MHALQLPKLVLQLSLVLLGTCTSLVAQDKSVKPGINNSFKDPNVAEFVERFEREGREVYDYRKRIIQYCDLKPGMSVADVGAGTGLFTRMIADQVQSKGKVYAIDIAPNFVDHVLKSNKDQTQIEGVVCTQDDVKLPPNCIDLAFVCDTYHHFEYPAKTLASLRRALRPGAELVLVEFHRKKGVSTDWIMGHVRAGQEVFVSEIKNAGFLLVEEKKFMKQSYWMRFRKADDRTARGHTTDSLGDVKTLIQTGRAVLLDVREQSEWDQGHLADAKLFPLSKIANSNPQVLDDLLPKDRIIYCHCKSGGRVLRATSILTKLGFDIRPLKEGFSSLAATGFPTSDDK